MSSVSNYPPELLFSICAAVYFAGIPAPNPSLDPLVLNSNAIPTALPSSLPPSHWPEPVSRRTLANLCLVNKSFYEAARPWLWRRIEVRLPRSWMAFVDEVTGGEEEINVQEVDDTIKTAASAALALKSPGLVSDEEAKKLHESILATLAGPDSSIPPELLSPPASREPSPRRIRAQSKSPARWKVLRSINEALQDAMERDGVYGKQSPDRLLVYASSFSQFCLSTCPFRPSSWKVCSPPGFQPLSYHWNAPFQRRRH